MGNTGLSQIFAGWITQGGGSDESYSSPNVTRGNWYIHWDTLVCKDQTQGATTSEKVILSCCGKVALIYRGCINTGKSLLHQERGRVHKAVFSLGHFSAPCIFTFWKKSLFLPCLEKTHSAKLWCSSLFPYPGLSAQPCSPERHSAPGHPWGGTEMATRAAARQHPKPSGSTVFVPWARRSTGKANVAIAGCTMWGPPGKMSVKQGLHKEDSVLQKSSLGAFPPPSWGAARAGHQAQPCHRPGAWWGSRGAALSLSVALVVPLPIHLPAGGCGKGVAGTLQKHRVWPTKKGRCLRLQGEFSNPEELNPVDIYATRVLPCSPLCTGLPGVSRGCPQLFPGTCTEGGEWR